MMVSSSKSLVMVSSSKSLVMSSSAWMVEGSAFLLEVGLVIG